jgi:small subunit ribosomal protein S20
MVDMGGDDDISDRSRVCHVIPRPEGRSKSQHIALVAEAESAWYNLALVANIKSQKKRILTNEKARLQNQATRSRLRTHARRFREALASGDRGAAESALRAACRAYDKAAEDGVIHKNNAANHKSRLWKQFNAAA